MTISLQNEAPSEYSTDLAILEELRGHLLETLHVDRLENPSGLAENSHLLVKKPTRDGRGLRVYVNNRQTMLNLQGAYFVAFMGEKKAFIRDEVNDEISKLDYLMTRELIQYPFILSYLSLELPDRYNYANLVVLSSLESLGQWKESPFHRAAARELSPDFYQQARIHVGSLESGLQSPFNLIRTSLYDFSVGKTRLSSRKVY